MIETIVMNEAIAPIERTEVHRVSKNCANLFFVRTLPNFDRL